MKGVGISVKDSVSSKHFDIENYTMLSIHFSQNDEEALHHAAKSGHFETCFYLLVKGADLSARSKVNGAYKQTLFYANLIIMILGGKATG